MNKLPDDIKGPVGNWVKQNCKFISVDTILSTHQPNVLVLKDLLERVRFVVRRSKMFHAQKGEGLYSREMREWRLRREVRDMSRKFMFNMEALREHHPIHNAEIIVILLNLLKLQGVDATVKSSTPETQLRA